MTEYTNFTDVMADSFTGTLIGNVTGNVAGGVTLPTQAISANGAITLKSGVVLLTKADGAVAATLAAPAAADNGKILYIVSTTAQAHTVTATTIGFNAGDAAKDVATLGGAIGDGLVVLAYGGEWYVLANTNATIA